YHAMKRPPARCPLCLRIPIFVQPLCRSGALLSEVKCLLSGWSMAILVLTALSLSFTPLKAAEEEALDFTSLGGGFDYTQGSYSLGWRFTANTNAEVTALGFYDDQKNGLTGNHPVGIYDVQTRQLVASTTVLPSDPLTGFF